MLFVLDRKASIFYIRDSGFWYQQQQHSKVNMTSPCIAAAASIFFSSWFSKRERERNKESYRRQR